MRDEDQPFILYKSGFGFRIVPRNAAGYRATFVWLALLAPIVGAFAYVMSHVEDGTTHAVATGAYIAAMLAWSILGIRFMKARSEVVDMRELLELKRERDRDRNSKRR